MAPALITARGHTAPWNLTDGKRIKIGEVVLRFTTGCEKHRHPGNRRSVARPVDQQRRATSFPGSENVPPRETKVHREIARRPASSTAKPPLSAEPQSLARR